jgi:hypothetical protein
LRDLALIAEVRGLVAIDERQDFAEGPVAFELAAEVAVVDARQ